MVTGSTGSYTVLARRFRPQGFADVVGQEHIAKALRNAILANRVAHAYLFTGARGVGKTSTARILAKALNCPKSVDGNPCNDCEICDGIAAGNDVDVLEIDGASNNGVDNIRQLRSNVNVSSMRSRFKVYIIDEVHMLSTSAFNALLKTLEEPPPNVKFVFCTTEPHKIPDTILSRCQRFDFGTIETSNIKALLAHIAQAEGVEVDDEALELVARRAAGSMRDSQSIFDQLLAFGEEHISAVDVHRLLGTASDDRLIDIGEALVERDKSKAIDSFHAALDGGVQLGELTDQLLFYLRDLMILASGAATVGLLSVAPVSREQLQKQAETWGLQTIVAAMQILSDTKGRMQRVTYGRALAELALIRIAMLEDLTAISELIDKLRSGEPVTAIQTQEPAVVAEKKNEIETVGSPSEGDQPVTPEQVYPAQVVPATEQAREVVDLSDVNQPDVDQRPGTTDVPADEDSTAGQVAPEKLASEDSTLEEPVDVPVRIESATSHVADSEKASHATERRSETGDADGQISGDGSVGSELATGGIDEVNSSVAEESHSGASSRTEHYDGGESDEIARADGEISNADAQSAGVDEAESDTVSQAESGGLIRFTPENSAEIWAKVVPEITDMLKSHVKSVSRIAISAPNKLELTLPAKYHFGKTYLEKPEAQNRLQEIVRRLTGVEPRITVVVGEADAVDSKSATAESANRQPKRVFRPENDELVCAVVEVFSAQVVRISPLSAGAGDNES